jgi:hypothetical protein
MIARHALPVSFAVLVLFAACRKAEVTAYRVPKENEPESSAAAAMAAPSQPATAPASPGMAGTPVATAQGAGLTWTAPAGWTQKPDMPMRKATYGVPAEAGEAELAITAFPNSVGGELANLNRWRGQMQLPPVGESELGQAFTRLEHNGLHIAVVDLANPSANPQRMLAAMVPASGATWFFKLTGSDAALAKVRPEFLQFLSTLKPAGSAP